MMVVAGHVEETRGLIEWQNKKQDDPFATEVSDSFASVAAVFFLYFVSTDDAASDAVVLDHICGFSGTVLTGLGAGAASGGGGRHYWHHS